MVLEDLGVAALVIDRDRMIRWISPGAVRLLGFHPEEIVGKRCRLTTRGDDCENACPLTAILRTGENVVRGFPAVYRRSDGRALPVSVNLYVVRNGAGEMTAAVEILELRGAAMGFYLEGSSHVAAMLRGQVGRLAENHRDVVLLGEGPACRSVAMALHRQAGLPDSLFHSWEPESSAVPAWPPGTLYVETESRPTELLPSVPSGWRVIAGAREPESADGIVRNGFETLELPALRARMDDLPDMLTAWVCEMDGTASMDPGAAIALARWAVDRGLEEVELVLAAAVARHPGRLREEHLTLGSQIGDHLERLLDDEEPLKAMERCVLEETLRRCGWKVQEAADRLGISRVTLWRRMKEYGIERRGDG